MAMELFRIAHVVTLAVLGVCVWLLMADMGEARWIWKKAPLGFNRMTNGGHRLVMAATLFPLGAVCLIKAWQIGTMESFPSPRWLSLLQNSFLMFISLGFTIFHPFRGALESHPETSPGG